MTTDPAFTAGWAACREAAAKAMCDGCRKELAINECGLHWASGDVLEHCHARPILRLPAATPADAQEGEGEVV